jgi:hypothetical protein
VHTGQYGDEQQARFFADLSQTQGNGEVDIPSLTPGDLVHLVWRHEYVHKGGSHFPERPLVLLERITQDEADALALQHVST